MKLWEEAHTSERLGPVHGPEDHRHEEWQRSLPCQVGRVVGIRCSGGLASEIGAAAFLMNKFCCEYGGVLCSSCALGTHHGASVPRWGIAAGQDHCSRIVESAHVAAGL